MKDTKKDNPKPEFDVSYDLATEKDHTSFIFWREKDGKIFVIDELYLDGEKEIKGDRI